MKIIWKKIDTYSIEPYLGETKLPYTVSKYVVSGSVLFTAWHIQKILQITPDYKIACKTVEDHYGKNAEKQRKKGPK